MSNIVDQYRITQEPYYRAVADEVEGLFTGVPAGPPDVGAEG